MEDFVMKVSVDYADRLDVQIEIFADMLRYVHTGGGQWIDDRVRQEFICRLND
jgi:phage gp37-like protein